MKTPMNAPSQSMPFTDLNKLKLDNSYARLPEYFYHRVQPTPLEHPFLISVNSDVAKQLGINPNSLEPEALATLFSGQQTLPGSEPLAMKYTGHQFGVYNPQLGDGRGLLLGELIGPDQKRWDLHLKGSGKTNYSRFGDGRAILRSSIREYLVSAAMQGLGIPTTQALCLVGSHEKAIRDGMPEPCATVLRVTQCHIRFGHFEHFYHNQRYDDLTLLSNYCLERFFPELLDTENPPLAMLKEVIQRSARLVAQWQAYGFVHGVMNTDNMSLIGETFDYGPYQFMDQYKSNTVSNHSDHQGRYAFDQQPEVMLWNLYCLAQCFVPLVHKDGNEAKALLETVLSDYREQYKTAYYTLMSQRLGLSYGEKTSSCSVTASPIQTSPCHSNNDHRALIDDLIILMNSQQTDSTLFFRVLSEHPIDQQLIQLQQIMPRPQAFELWLSEYHQALNQSSEAAVRQEAEVKRLVNMQGYNPVYLLRNYMAQDAIDGVNQGDFTLLNQLLLLLKDPFTEYSSKDESHGALAQYSSPAPDWAEGICLSCSS